MKKPIESITEIYEAGQEHPGLYDDIKVPNRILVAVMVQLAQNLEDFKDVAYLSPFWTGEEAKFKPH